MALRESPPLNRPIQSQNGIMDKWWWDYLSQLADRSFLPITNGFVVANGGAGFTRTLMSGSSKLSIDNATGIAGNPEFDVVETNINHDNLSGFVADEHISHSTISIIAGTGLNGGGTIDSNVTINADAPDVALITTTTLSDNATADFTGLSSTYNYYKLILSNVVPATDNASLLFRTSANAGSSYDNGASDYAWSRAFLNQSAIAETYATDAADTSIVLAPSVGSDTNESISGTIEIFNPSASAYTSIIGKFVDINSDGQITKIETSGMRLAATATNAVQILFNSGNLESGTIRLYGYQ